MEEDSDEPVANLMNDNAQNIAAARVISFGRRIDSWEADN
jgi:hypothetical protein